MGGHILSTVGDALRDIIQGPYRRSQIRIGGSQSSISYIGHKTHLGMLEMSGFRVLPLGFNLNPKGKPFTFIFSHVSNLVGVYASLSLKEKEKKDDVQNWKG